MESALQSQYFYGVLKAFLPLGLLWEPKQQPIASNLQLAPSWSWVSCDGKLICSEIENKDSAIEFRGVADMGDFRGILCLKAKMISCYVSKEGWEMVEEYDDLQGQVEYSSIKEAKSRTDKYVRTEHIRHKYEIAFTSEGECRSPTIDQDYSLFDSERGVGVEYIFLRVTSYKVPARTRCCGLILQEIQNSRNPYQRVGVGRPEDEPAVFNRIESCEVRII